MIRKQDLQQFGHIHDSFSYLKSTDVCIFLMIHLNYIKKKKKKKQHQGVYVNTGSPVAFLKKYINPMWDP